MDRACPSPGRASGLVPPNQFERPGPVMAAKKAPLHKLSSKMPKTPPTRIEAKEYPAGEWDDGKCFMIDYWGHVLHTGTDKEEEIVTSSEKSGDYLRNGVFVFIDRAGEERELPLLDDLDVDSTEWLESQGSARWTTPTTTTRALISRIDPAAAEACRAPMSRKRLDQISAMWSKAGSVTLGESSASDDS